jgi:hypothetical protein
LFIVIPGCIFIIFASNIILLYHQHRVQVDLLQVIQYWKLLLLLLLWSQQQLQRQEQQVRVVLELVVVGGELVVVVVVLEGLVALDCHPFRQWALELFLVAYHSRAQVIKFQIRSLKTSY